MHAHPQQRIEYDKTVHIICSNVIIFYLKDFKAY